MPNMLFAHTQPGRAEEDWEPLASHLTAVGVRAAEFAEVFGGELLAGAAGRLHDIGKASARFQPYLRGEAASTDHSTAGAQLACERYGEQVGKLLAFCVAGHHAGLADGAGADGSTLADTAEARPSSASTAGRSWASPCRRPCRLRLPSASARTGRASSSPSSPECCSPAWSTPTPSAPSGSARAASEREAWPELPL